MRQRRHLALYLLLGFSAGLPLYMFTSVLTLRLAQHDVDIAIIGFFAWVALIPSFKFLWAPLIERWSMPGFGACWGKPFGWIMLSQLGIVSALAGMALTSADANLPMTALFAVCLAFWTATLEIAADGWRITLAPTPDAQGAMVTANLWGYRAAMVAAGSGAVWVAAKADWTAAYLAIAVAAFLPFPLLAALPAVAAESPKGNRSGRLLPLVTGLVVGSGIVSLSAALVGAIGTLVLRVATKSGIGGVSDPAPVVFALCATPFAVLALLLPKIARLGPDSAIRQSATVGPYVDIFWRYGFAVLGVIAFISMYRMGDVLAMALNHPMWNALGYRLEAIAVADGAVSVAANVAGVAVGGWAAAHWPMARALICGAVAATVGNLAYAWLWSAQVADGSLYGAVAIDQFANGMAAAIFVVYLSMLVNPRYPAAQYAFLSGLAFLLPRVLAGASGSIQKSLGYDGFFMLCGAMSLAAIAFLPFALRAKTRSGPEGSSSPPQMPPAPDP